MNEEELISNWRDQKTSANYRCLVDMLEVEFELSGLLGHPSQYAMVKFVAKPADTLSLRFAVQWPDEFNDIYKLRIKHSIAESVVDVLFSSPPARTMGLHRGCELILTKFGWHAVSGSEAAVRRAAVKALEQLCATGRWRDITGRYRIYP